MAYAAIITKIRKIRPLEMKDGSFADNVNLATACDYQVVVSKSVEEETLGVYFPFDGQLSREMCMANNLYRKHPETDEPMGGYFGANGRVRVQKFLGHESWGFWTPIDSLFWIENFSVADQKEGEEITEINGKLICQKYYAPSTIAAMNKSSKTPKMNFSVDSFAKHYNTPKLRISGRSIEAGSILYITSKCHGTSGRAGNLSVTEKLSKPKLMWNKVAAVIGLPLFSDSKFCYVSGTRNTIRNPFVKLHEAATPDVRMLVDDELKNVGLRKGETLYFEIVGYDSNGSLIMGAHTIEDKVLKKRYGPRMEYRYGCRFGERNHRILVYRITQQGPDENVIELSQAQMKLRCDTLGLETVPMLVDAFIYDGNLEALLERCELLSRGDSVLDSTHIREGVVVRIEGAKPEAMKYKSFWFCSLENIKKNDETYVDPEEIS